MNPPFFRDLTVAAGGAVGTSTSYQLGGTVYPVAPVSIETPADLNGVDRVRVQVSNDDITYLDIFVEGDLVPLALTASRVLTLPPALSLACLGWAYMRLLTTDAANAAEDPTANTIFRIRFVEAESIPGSAELGGIVDPGVDTELPAAALLADNTATPTAPAVGAFGMMYDGATWDFVRGTAADGLTVNTELPAAIAAADNMANPTAPQVLSHLMVWDGATWDRAPGTSALGLQVDTEMPAAALLADNTATPTAPAVAAFGMMYDGATWDFLRGTSADGLTVNTELPAAALLADNAATPTAPAVGAFLMVYDGATWDFARGTALGGVAVQIFDGAGEGPVDVSGEADALGGVTALRVHNSNLLYNGATYDRERNNVDATLLASAARTTTQTSADIVNYNGVGIVVTLDMTVVGTGSVTVTINYKDPASGKYILLLSGAAITTNSTNKYVVHPSIPAVANVSAQTHTGRTLQIVVTANNANAATYSVGYTLLQN